MDKEDTHTDNGYTYNEILFSLLKGDPVICDNVDESKQHYAK